jgi:hypothetical protein
MTYLVTRSFDTICEIEALSIKRLRNECKQNPCLMTYLLGEVVVINDPGFMGPFLGRKVRLARSEDDLCPIFDAVPGGSHAEFIKDDNLAAVGWIGPGLVHCIGGAVVDDNTGVDSV